MNQLEIRRSIRKYLQRPVEDEKIRQLLESARLAPSGSNTQPWHFVVVKDPLIRGKLAEASHKQSWMLSAPVFIVCVGDIMVRMKNHSEMIVNEDSPEEEVKLIIRDSSIAITHLMVEAVNLGLGSCWVAWFRQDEIRPIVNIPRDKYVVGIITVGYADENPNPRPRKKLEDIVHYEHW